MKIVRTELHESKEKIKYFHASYDYVFYRILTWVEGLELTFKINERGNIGLIKSSKIFDSIKNHILTHVNKAHCSRDSTLAKQCQFWATIAWENISPSQDFRCVINWTLNAYARIIEIMHPLNDFFKQVSCVIVLTFVQINKTTNYFNHGLSTLN